MLYVLEVKKNVLKAIARLDSGVQRQIAEVLKNLVSHPYPSGSRKIQGRADTWRVRVGKFRVVYEVHDERLVICVVRVAHRKDVYKNL